MTNAANSDSGNRAAQDPDFVDRLFDLLLSSDETRSQLVNKSDSLGKTIDEMKKQIRQEYGGAAVYVRSRVPQDQLRHQVLSIFNGRNATEIARKLGIGRATVYRLIKQPGRIKA